MPPPGQRLVAWGWAAATALALLSTRFAGEMAGRFGGGPVLLRPWLQSYNLVVGGLNLVTLMVLALGSARVESGAARRVALAAFVAASFFGAALLLLPLVRGGGPFAPDALEVRALRVMVFAPSLLRAVGCAALTLALFRSHTASYVILGLLAADAGLVAWKWAATPHAVLACVHPYCGAPLGLVPWLLASALFLALLSGSTRANPALSR
jgi:hypothetical protein